MRYLCITLLCLSVLSPGLSKANNSTHSESRLIIAEPSDWFSDSAIASADSRAKDEEALVALYNATNGNNWDNRRGWSGTSMSLDDDIFGVEVEKIDGELRVVLIRLNNNGTGEPRNNPEDNKGNNLTGTLPNELGNLKELRHFNVMSNDISGELPRGMRYCNKIEEAYFEGTKSTNPGVYTGEGEWGEPPTPQERAISLDGGKWDNFNRWSYNNFSGSLPAEWSDWKNIRIVSIAGTVLDSDGKATIEGIKGQLPPEWGQWSNIVQLYLHVNKMNGPLPKEWAGMTELVDLWLGGNQFGNRTEGHPDANLPAEWGGGTSYGEGMRKMRHLSIGGGRSGGSSGDYFNGAWTSTFDGPIPENWGNMKMLHKIILPDFNTKQDFPNFFNSGNYHNRVTSSSPDPDAIPVEAWTVGLTTISGIDNMTSMPDPSELTYLSRFVANGNSFNEQVPSTIGQWTRMKQLLISNTGLSGTFPDLKNWSGTKIFEIAHNNFTGNLPELNNNDSAQRNIQAQNSGFSGAIPASWNFPGSNGFFRLWLHDNNLSGPIPQRLADPGHSYSSGFRLDGNRYVFADLVPFIKLGPNNFKYAPQQAFGSAKTYYLSEGESITLEDFTTVVTHSGNRYQWQKDGADISGATSRTLSISSFSAADEGTYTLVVTNPGAPDLTLTSHEITLTIGDGSNNDGDSNETQKISAPVQVAPNDGAINTSQTPMFEWEPVDGADFYILHGNRINPGEMKIDVEVQGTSYKVQDYLDPETTHHWRVRAVKDGVEGEWSPIWEFKTKEAPLTVPGTPDLISPEADSKDMGRNITFSWKSIPEADSYQLRFSKEQNFGTIVTDSSGITTTSTDIQGLTYSNTYYWQVRAVNAAGAGNWSETRSFTVRNEPVSAPVIPELRSPENGAEGVAVNPTFSWASATDAESYRLQLSEQENFATTLVDSSGITDTVSEVKGLANESTYYWRVQAINDKGESGWSQVRFFITKPGNSISVSKPVLNFPVNNAADVSLTPILRWKPVESDHYVLRIIKSETSELVTESIVLDTKYSIKENLDPETTYNWKVRAVKDGVKGEWSSEWTFTTGQRDDIMETILEQNYPNPFNPSTQIRFNLGETQDVSLKVYDTVGRLVATLVEGTLTAGTYERSFRADNLASGVYFIRLITKNRVLTSQMTLMK